MIFLCNTEYVYAIIYWIRLFILYKPYVLILPSSHVRKCCIVLDPACLNRSLYVYKWQIELIPVILVHLLIECCYICLFRITHWTLHSKLLCTTLTNPLLLVLCLFTQPCIRTVNASTSLKPLRYTLWLDNLPPTSLPTNGPLSRIWGAVIRMMHQSDADSAHS